jgi:uncharacterized paraquat-inducible protein A
MLAHQGGWDEILLPALFVLALVAIPAIRDRRRRRSEPSGARGERRSPVRTCEYCGDRTLPQQARCPRCGFRTSSGGG